MKDLWWWSYLLTSIGVLSWYLIGKKNILGFVIAIIGQILWMMYGYVSHQTGFMLSALAYGSIQIKGLIDWLKK